MLKKEKKTHRSPNSKTKADEERKNWSRFFFFFFFSDCEYRGLEFQGWQVGNGTSANESVSKKTKKKKKKRIRSKERDSVVQWVDF